MFLVYFHVCVRLYLIATIGDDTHTQHTHAIERPPFHHRNHTKLSQDVEHVARGGPTAVCARHGNTFDKRAQTTCCGTFLIFLFSTLFHTLEFIVLSLLQMRTIPFFAFSFDSSLLCWKTYMSYRHTCGHTTCSLQLFIVVPIGRSKLIELVPGTSHGHSLHFVFTTKECDSCAMSKTIKWILFSAQYTYKIEAIGRIHVGSIFVVVLRERKGNEPS